MLFEYFSYPGAGGGGKEFVALRVGKRRCSHGTIGCMLYAPPKREIGMGKNRFVVLLAWGFHSRVVD